MRPTGLTRLIGRLGLIGLLCLIGLAAHAQTGSITIGGNVYGGGNHAEVRGTSKATVRKGTLNNVFGGARMANVGGNTFVNIDGENATGDIMITNVYGGNDISGHIGTAADVDEQIPTELTDIIPEKTASELEALGKTKDEYIADCKAADPNKNYVDRTWNSFVRASRSSTGSPAVENYAVIVGTMYGGGNGDFQYIDEETGDSLRDAAGNYIAKEGETTIAISPTPLNIPEIDKTYLEIKGGNIAHLYGGGNNATIRENTTIYINNESETLEPLVGKYAQVQWNADPDKDPDVTAEGPHTLKYYAAYTMELLKSMSKLSTFQSDLTSIDFNFARIFGGNNKAEMAIRPIWNLRKGKVRDLYSGGNKGNMTSPEGLLVEIPDDSQIDIINLFGGCRMADVVPTVNGVYTPCTNLPGYNFPNELSARVLVRGGHINNVYGGNDITGDVFGGNAIGIYSTIYGDVYGAGNGAYAYTDNADELGDKELFSDFFFNTTGYDTPYEALNAHRPNAEQVSIRLTGKTKIEDGKEVPDPDGVTYIKGSVYIGGNCASLATKKNNPLVEVKIGSNVVVENMFLGNNGEKMTDPDILELYASNVDDEGNIDPDGTDYSSLDLRDANVMAEYMEGVAMTLKPRIVFDNIDNEDPTNYLENSSYIGSFYCGGNVGSMAIGGKQTYTIDHGLNIFTKFVGGCNSADVPQGPYNAAYEGGVIGIKDERPLYTDGGNIQDRLEINLDNLTITPLRWDNTTGGLVWNTVKWSNYIPIEEGTELAVDSEYYTYDSTTKEYTKHTVTTTPYTVTNSDDFYQLYEDFAEVDRDPTDRDIRLLGGNVYGGCYNSGHVNGNVTININDDVLKRKEVFGTGSGPYGRPASGVELLDQRDDLESVALIVFGAGFGEDTEVWGSATVNHKNGYAFQICGGGERGVVGKKKDIVSGETIIQEYRFDPAYSTTVNLMGSASASDDESEVENLAEAEYIYGGGKEGNVCGNTLVNLGNGRIYDAFAGACEADILGHSEAYIGRQPDGSGGYKTGIPWIQDIVYGGNDFCGTIYGEYEDGYDFKARIENYDDKKAQLHGYTSDNIPDVMKSATYVEYLIGHVDTIYGGGYGFYDYNDTDLYGEGYTMPIMHSSFVNIRPTDHPKNHIKAVFGGGTGYPGYREGDLVQDRSYVLIDIPDSITSFSGTHVFGSGSYSGLGMKNKYIYDPATGRTFNESGTAVNIDEASAIIDLLHGRIHNVYGGSFIEGITRRTVVNVPSASTLQIDSIFGGAYGKEILPPCDVYQTQVNYKSGDAQVFGAIFGGNNRERRSLYTQVNISAPVWSNKTKGYGGTIYGAGRGIDTWSEYTEVNMLLGSRAYNVYGGGELGHVLNSESVQKYMQLYKDHPSPQIGNQDPYWKDNKYDLESNVPEVRSKAEARWAKDWADAWTLGSYFTPVIDENDDGIPEGYDYTKYAENTATNLSRISERSELDDKTAVQLAGKTVKKFNSNVIIYEGAIVDGYAYGGGLGDNSVERTGDIYGTSYIAVLGGEVKKDVYAAGRAGGLDDLFNAGYTASANAYIRGGTARNVYGGGYLGHVGHHEGDITAPFSEDRLAESHVVIGKAGTNTYAGGAPAITRNVYGGGEGGSVYGTSTVSINNGYVGYRAINTGTADKPKYRYVEELEDQKPGDLDLSGNVFGGGYVINSYVDYTNVNMYGGTIRGSLYGGGEIGPIGRGTIKKDLGITGSIENQDATIIRAGKTHVRMFNGHVLRNVFGGGRGKDSWGGDGTMYMDPALVARLDLKCKGYVFGQTDVNIYGGEIGTDEGIARNFGNVFGGGDEGSVYSAYEQNGTLFIGHQSGVRYDKGDEGYYYKYNGTNYVDDAGTALAGNTEKFLTEDCHVLIEPWLQVKASIDYDSKTYNVGDYIPTSYLNTLPKKTKEATTWPVAWNSVDAGSIHDDEFIERGIIIHNAVFAGGNIGVGSEMYVNTKTVFGNATATIHDVYNRDLITIGTGYTGGLYGDGNLTFVDGYRELNVTNYGTDFHNIKETISYTDYLKLPPREQAYYELKYRCIQACTDNEGTSYTPGSTIPRDELLVRFENNKTIIGTDGKPNPLYWTENGVVSRYAGRILNTIQRADFCGVFGSRMVMRGAKDRVPEVADNTNYTINRVREVSLNKKASVVPGDAGEYATHGNYFGIYSVVNHLGALTSDMDFYDAVRTTDNKDEAKYKKPTANGKSYGTATYADWKEQFHKDPRRNNGLSHNELALASGVFLELTTEESKGKTLNEKEWGIITGVVQLDLINVSKGIGGGFVYAKNIHGVRESTSKTNTLLSDLNKTGGVGGARAVTNRIWKYRETVENDEDVTNPSQEEWQTSGNFVHNSEIIIDDCYNISGRYLMSNRVPAHYWYIRGSVYVYDQYITAHTGSPSAYSQAVELPITISAAAHNKMKLMDVQPNLYAYYNTSHTQLGKEQKLVIQDEEYYLNTPISYWDWYLLPKSEQALFVEETYVTSATCKIGTDEEIKQSGYVMLPDEYTRLYNKTELVDITPNDGIDNKVKAVKKMIKDENGDYVVATDKNGDPIYVTFESVFHSSNEMAHDTGYLLTYKMNNPKPWDTWYTQASSTTHDKQQNPEDGWENGPTYYLDPSKLGEGENGKLLGQREYNESDIIPQKTYDDYKALANKPASGQATFVPAYVVTNECSTDERHYYEGAPVSESVGTSLGANAKLAYVCTATIQLTPTEYIFINDLMTSAEKETLKTKYPSSASLIENNVVPAYYCTNAGLYGGNYYLSGQNYRALEAWSSMSDTDREYFKFNYDAFDLLIDPDYSYDDDGLGNYTLKYPEGQKYQYDSAAGTLAGANANPAHYSLSTPMDYTATYDKESLYLEGNTITVTRGGVETKNVTTIQKDDVLDREVYESLINEQYHYAPIDVPSDSVNKTMYVVKEAFYYIEPYAAGQVIDKETFNNLPHSSEEGELNLQPLIDQLSFTAEGIYYYCRDSYTIDTNGTAVTDINSGSHTQGSTVNVGTIINSTNYGTLKNLQKNFTLHGISPTETTTLYVSRNADYDDLSKEKIITVIYQYDYEESDESGTHITPISERHVVRIHVTFENGVPIVEDIQEPDIVLPGTSITMRIPGITSNGYEIIGGGWELFEDSEDAESHFSGKEYTPSSDPLYWYQDDFYIAYYAKTFNRGKTYSNAVPVHVANYHDLKAVMDDKVNHLHIDYDRTRMKRDSKIYINDYNGSKDGIDLLKDLFDLSLINTSTEGITVVGDSITNAGHRLKGHHLLNTSTAEGTNIHDSSKNIKGVKGAKNLEFFLRTDIAHSDDPAVPDEWTPIGTDDNCFKGVLHGDGHTISGLDNSLFHNLCGEVYNLGVMGSFTSAGVADLDTEVGVDEKGYVESCWVKSSATTTDAATKPNAVFGKPTDTDGYQLVNSYFWNGNKNLYNNIEGDNLAVDDDTETITSGGVRGKATAKSSRAFYNGELAYDLNNFYLYKRYSDQQVTSGADDQSYQYYTINNENKPELQLAKYYASNPDFCSSGYLPSPTPTGHVVPMYVEDRFNDGDFRYAAGEIPTEVDERLYVDEDNNNKQYFFPIWPDDYIFFGQKLTFGWAAEAHQEVPTAVARDGGRLSQNDDANRVYRAPAYYRSKEMGVAYFNPTAYLAQKKVKGEAPEGGTYPDTLAYPNMTAIDFAGHEQGHDKSAYTLAKNDGKWFYSPLLDDDGLISIKNCDETQNLLVYAPDTDYNKKTYNVLTSTFAEPAYNTYYSDPDGYRLVGEAPVEKVFGHVVQNNKTATNDHLLVDKQDFNAPFAYTFDGGHRMWYQRTPGNNEYVDLSNGWQGISVPFTAELVTTNVKGEITHFYDYKENTTGHEYWLRKFDGITEETTPSVVARATFNYPSTTLVTKEYTNTFLWDYYYKNESVHNQKDENLDTYLKYRQYYNSKHEHENYPLLTAATPYIIGFPGKTYYEFDLSGNFEAKNTAVPITKLEKQVITLASEAGIRIGVSDKEMAGVTKLENGTKNYTVTFKPSYMNMELEAGTNSYALDADGNSFDKVPNSGDATKVSAFRPYFIAEVTSPSPSRRDIPEQIIFGGTTGEIEVGPESAFDGTIEIYAQGHNIVTRSHMKEATTIRITNTAGITLTNFVLMPGETIETPVRFSGVYIVNKKKLFVK